MGENVNDSITNIFLVVFGFLFLLILFLFLFFIIVISEDWVTTFSIAYYRISPLWTDDPSDPCKLLQNSFHRMILVLVNFGNEKGNLNIFTFNNIVEVKIHLIIVAFTFLLVWLLRLFNLVFVFLLFFLLVLWSIVWLRELFFVGCFFFNCVVLPLLFLTLVFILLFFEFELLPLFFRQGFVHCRCQL